MALSDKKYQSREYYTVRSLLGNQWANWFVLIGARERGKSYSVLDYVLNDYFDPKSKLYHKPFYWMRLNEIAVKNMLMNNGAKMFESLLRRCYNIDEIKVSGDTVYLVNRDIDEEGKETVTKSVLCYVWGLSVAYNNKGAAIFDSDNFKGANIVIDEIALEKGQRKTFDLVYNLKMQIENIARSKRENVRIFMILNNTEECPAVCAMFNFIPTEFGRYKLKSKHCVIDYIPNTEAYDKRRKNALANELDNGTGNFTNAIERDMRLIYKGRLKKPSSIIKFTKDKNDWFTVWDGTIIAPYNGEQKGFIAMRRYIDEVFRPEMVATVIEMTDARNFKFKDLMTKIRFEQYLQEIKK